MCEVFHLNCHSLSCQHVSRTFSKMVSVWGSSCSLVHKIIRGCNLSSTKVFQALSYHPTTKKTPNQTLISTCIVLCKRTELCAQLASANVALYLPSGISYRARPSRQHNKLLMLGLRLLLTHIGFGEESIGEGNTNRMPVTLPAVRKHLQNRHKTIVKDDHVALGHTMFVWCIGMRIRCCTYTRVYCYRYCCRYEQRTVCSASPLVLSLRMRVKTRKRAFAFV